MSDQYVLVAFIETQVIEWSSSRTSVPNALSAAGRRPPGAVLGHVDCLEKVAGTKVTLCFVMRAVYSAIDTFMESSQETEKIIR